MFISTKLAYFCGLASSLAVNSVREAPGDGSPRSGRWRFPGGYCHHIVIHRGSMFDFGQAKWLVNVGTGYPGQPIHCHHPRSPSGGPSHDCNWVGYHPHFFSGFLVGVIHWGELTHLLRWATKITKQIAWENQAWGWGFPLRAQAAPVWMSLWWIAWKQRSQISVSSF
jgi:hypothetical protein